MKDHKIHKEEIIIRIFKDEEKENCAPYYIKNELKKKKIPQKNFIPFQDITSLIVKKKESDKEF